VKIAKNESFSLEKSVGRRTFASVREMGLSKPQAGAVLVPVHGQIVGISALFVPFDLVWHTPCLYWAC